MTGPLVVAALARSLCAADGRLASGTDGSAAAPEFIPGAGTNGFDADVAWITMGVRKEAEDGDDERVADLKG